MKRNRKAKILATLGPASSDKKIIEDLFVAGCDVFRLNFSHGDLETHRKNYENIRSLEKKHNHASCILADLQGPKLRVGTFKNTKENLVKGQSFVLDLENEIQELPNLPIFDLKSQDSKTLIATLTKDDDLNSLFDKLSEHGIKVKSMRNEQNRLEELFIRLVKEKDGN